MQACLLTFNTRSGTGTQTISGVVDQNGVPFAGKVFIAIGGSSALNTLAPQTFGNYATLSMGIDNGTLRGATAVMDTSQFGNNKVASINASLNSLLLDGGANAFFGGDVFRQAYITAIAVGAFTLTYTFNQRTGDAYMVLVLGGADLTVDLISGILGNHAYTTSNIPQGVLGFYTQAFSNTGGVTTGSGGGAYGSQWDTRNSGRGIALHYIRTNDTNSRFQTASYSSAALQYNSPTVTGLTTVAAWGNNSFTTGSGGINNVIAFSGPTITCTAGSFLQPTVDGLQTVQLGLNAAAIIFQSIGLPPSTTADVGTATYTLGLATPAAAATIWNGETGNFNTVLTGTRKLQECQALMFATPNGASTAFHSFATIVSVSVTGTLVLYWANTDGVAREILWFAVGGASAQNYCVPSLPIGAITVTNSCIGAIGQGTGCAAAIPNGTVLGGIGCAPTVPNG